MESHAYIRDGRACKICGLGPGHPVHLLSIPGLDEVAAAHARNVAEAEELTAQMRQPLADVSKRAGEMERKSPLFFGTGANPGLF